MVQKLLAYGTLGLIMTMLLGLSWMMGMASASNSNFNALGQMNETPGMEQEEETEDNQEAVERSQPQADDLDFSQDRNPAMNAPDQFSWEIMAAIVRPVQNGSNEAFFETWASDQGTFPKAPRPSECATSNPDPAHCPIWPGSEFQPDTHTSVTQQAMTGVIPESGPFSIIDPSEIVFRNRASFDFIVANDLWYVEGLQAAVQRAKDSQYDADSFVIQFPIAAIEIKTNWINILEAQKDDYHWAIDTDGQLVGLVAFHIMTKQIPNWTWATFEHVDNPGRCDLIGCTDRFGQVPAATPPNRDVGGLRYAPESLTPALEALFAEARLPEVWKNYRLKGSQMTFTDGIGRPILLGNSVTERGFTPTSSCMSCHSKSAIDTDGDFLSIFEVSPSSLTQTNRDTQSIPPLVVPDTQSPNFNQIGAGIVSANGIPNPSWFIRPTTLNPANSGKLDFMPLDFIWAFIKANNRTDL